MAKNSRTKNSAFNVIASLSEFMIKTILSFVIRTIFIRKLGTEFLGLDGLFTNILSLLSVTDLGLESAIVFSLYKPLAEKDEEKINILLNVYKKCYRYIGLVIMTMGLALMPFLHLMVNTDQDLGNIYIYFGLYLLQTLSTYWLLAYKQALLTADQKSYKSFIVSDVILGLKFVLQFLSLTVFKSFGFYVISGLVTTLIRNLMISYIVDKNYPYAVHYNGKKLKREEKNALTKNVFGMSLYRISSKVMNSTDNIVISTFINLTTTGLFSNYSLLISNVSMAINTMFSSMTASVGNLFAEGQVKKSEFIFRCITFMNFWVYGLASICFWELFNPFITIWLGNEFLLGKEVVLVIVLNFLMDGLQRSVIMYKDACGLFWKGKIRPVFSALFNIIISVILVQWMGITGVILGSILSRLITTWWFDPCLVYKHAFKMPVGKYFLRYFRSFFVVVLVALMIDGIMHFVVVGVWAEFFIKIALCLVVPNLVFWVLFRKSEEFGYMRGIINSKLKQKSK